MMKIMRHIDVATDELWLRHAATGTVIAGDNLGWMFSKKTLQTFPLIMRMMFKADTGTCKTRLASSPTGRVWPRAGGRSSPGRARCYSVITSRREMPSWAMDKGRFPMSYAPRDNSARVDVSVAGGG